MNAKTIFQPLTSQGQAEQMLEAIRKSGERARKDPEYARQLILSTGMYTKSLKIKKQFR